MIKTLKTIGLGVVVAGVLSSCAAASSPVTGFIYTDASGPVAVTSNTVGTKVGTSSAKSILGWVGIGDASVDYAAKKAGITKISHVDYHSTNILGIFATYEVVVYGE